MVGFEQFLAVAQYILVYPPGFTPSMLEIEYNLHPVLGSFGSFTDNKLGDIVQLCKTEALKLHHTGDITQARARLGALKSDNMHPFILLGEHIVKENDRSLYEAMQAKDWALCLQLCTANAKGVFFVPRFDMSMLTFAAKMNAPSELIIQLVNANIWLGNVNQLLPRLDPHSHFDLFLGYPFDTFAYVWSASRERYREHQRLPLQDVLEPILVAFPQHFSAHIPASHPSVLLQVIRFVFHNTDNEGGVEGMDFAYAFKDWLDFTFAVRKLCIVLQCGGHVSSCSQLF